MQNNKTIKSPLVAGFMAGAMCFQSPAGHDVLYEGLLRAWFAKSWVEASIMMGRPISFQEFKSGAEIFLYEEDTDAFFKNVRLLNSDITLCWNNFEEYEAGGNNNTPEGPQTVFACHAALSRNEKGGKGQKGPKLV